MGHQDVDLYDATYGQFADNLYADVRSKAFGEDIGQNGWLTAAEHDLFLSWLQLDRKSRLLDVACGSGGPTLRAARLRHCSVHGLDANKDAVKTARVQSEEAGLSDKATFETADANESLALSDASFDAVICVDAINHLRDRARTLEDWARVLKPGGRIVFTDPIVVTGPLTNEEMRIRSSIGFFLFVPPGLDELLLGEAGFELLEKEDHTDNMGRMAGSWRAARQEREDDLRRIEGDETFEGQQRFLEVTARLADERRLSRFAFCAQRGR
ncbi:MAG TPA: methyltransferase domain-containing protein [Acidobacteriota bacterium]|nr:methyltransferase domain-containing protein [Acidobacteriota bacterium]